MTPSLKLREICMNAVSTCKDFPSDAKANKEALGSVDITNFDQSYLDFLSGQIALEPRGPDLSDGLRTGRDQLAPYTRREMARCRLRFGNHDYWLYIDPIARSVVHWEAYD